MFQKPQSNAPRDNQQPTSVKAQSASAEAGSSEIKPSLEEREAENKRNRELLKKEAEAAVERLKAIKKRQRETQERLDHMRKKPGSKIPTSGVRG